jgi:hypothetical protein
LPIVTSRRAGPAPAAVAPAASADRDERPELRRPAHCLCLRRVAEPGVGRVDADERDAHGVVGRAVAVRVDGALEAEQQRVRRSVDLRPGREARDAHRHHPLPRRRDDPGQRRPRRLASGRRARVAAGRRVAVVIERVEAGRGAVAERGRADVDAGVEDRHGRLVGRRRCGRRLRSSPRQRHRLARGGVEAADGLRAHAEARQRGEVAGVDRRREAVPRAPERDRVAQPHPARPERGAQRFSLALERAHVGALLLGGQAVEVVAVGERGARQLDDHPLLAPGRLARRAAVERRDGDERRRDRLAAIVLRALPERADRDEHDEHAQRQAGAGREVRPGHAARRVA